MKRGVTRLSNGADLTDLCANVWLAVLVIMCIIYILGAVAQAVDDIGALLFLLCNSIDLRKRQTGSLGDFTQSHIGLLITHLMREGKIWK